MQLYTRRKVRCMIFLLYCSGINKPFIRKSERILFFKVLFISNFLIIKEENYSFHDKILSHGEKHLLIFKNSDVTAFDPVTCYLIF